MTDIETFRQQLDETERLAREAWRGNGWRLRSGTDEVWTGENEPGHTEIPIAKAWNPPTAAHIARWDPAWALRWVTAAREILDEHAPNEWTTGLGIKISHCRCCSDVRGDYAEDWPCPTVRALMSVYAPDEEPIAPPSCPTCGSTTRHPDSSEPLTPAHICSNGFHAPSEKVPDE